MGQKSVNACQSDCPVDLAWICPSDSHATLLLFVFPL